MQHSAKTVLELSRAISPQGLGPNVQRFLEERGITLRDALEKGGTMPVLLELIPDPYPTVEDLVQAIKDA